MKATLNKSACEPVPEFLSGAEMPCLMGILNVTEDSFSDGGAYCHTEKAVSKALELFEEGASIVDLGAESTRPGAKEIPPSIQLERLLPVIRGIFARKKDALLSVDTRSSIVAETVLQWGVQIINDVSGLQFDPYMGKVIARHDAYAVLMHMRGTPETMRSEALCRYTDVVEEVGTSLEKILEEALDCGIGRRKIILDAGIGFAKTPAQDFELIRGAAQLRQRLHLPLLYGPSRKSFLKECTGDVPAAERDFATMGVLCFLAQSGVEILRVHNVKGTRQALKAFLRCEKTKEE